MLARLYVFSDLWFNRLLKAIKASHQGLWLGLLSRADMQEVASRQYGDGAQYRSDAHNLRGLFDWEAEAIDGHFANGCRVLVASAGGGRELLALAKRNFHVAGFECQFDLVATSRRLLAEAGIQAQVEQAEPDRVPQGMGQHDALLLGWGAYIHIIGREARIAFLREFGQHGPVGAPLLMSFFVRQPQSRHFHWVRRLAQFLRRLRRDPGSLELGDTMDSTFDHYFTEDEVRGELVAGGFELLQFNDLPFGHAIARKLA